MCCRSAPCCLNGDRGVESGPGGRIDSSGWHEQDPDEGAPGRRRLERLRRDPRPPRVAVAVIPLLYEVGAEGEVDKVVVVTAPAQAQVRRLMARDRLGREDAEARVRVQMPVAEKARRADFVIDASGSIEETAGQVAKAWASLTGDAGE